MVYLLPHKNRIMLGRPDKVYGQTDSKQFNASVQLQFSYCACAGLLLLPGPNDLKIATSLVDEDSLSTSSHFHLESAPAETFTSVIRTSFKYCLPKALSEFIPITGPTGRTSPSWFTRGNPTTNSHHPYCMSSQH